MTTTRQFLDLLQRFEQFKAMQENPEHALMKLSDEQLTTLLQVMATTFTTLKREAMRRGIWDSLVQKGMGLKKSDLR